MNALLDEHDYSTNFDWALWRRLLRFTYPYKRYLACFMLLAVVVGVCEGSYNSLIKVVVDGVNAHGRAAPLGLYALVYFAITAVLTLSVYCFIVLGGRLSSSISHDVRRAGFARLQALEFAFFDKRP